MSKKGELKVGVPGKAGGGTKKVKVPNPGSHKEISAPISTEHLAPRPMDPNAIDGYEKHELEGSMRTLMDAHDIMSDGPKMKAVSKHMKKMRKRISSTDDLRRTYQEKYGPDNDNDEDDY